MKHKVDWLSQQYRIRAEYAHRIAIEAWERQIDEARSLRTDWTKISSHELIARADEAEWQRAKTQKH